MEGVNKLKQFAKTPHQEKMVQIMIDRMEGKAKAQAMKQERLNKEISSTKQQ